MGSSIVLLTRRMYQGAGRGLDIELINQLERLVQDNLRPDLTVIFDLDPSIGLEGAPTGAVDKLKAKLVLSARARGYQYIASRVVDVAHRCKPDAGNGQTEFTQGVGG